MSAPAIVDGTTCLGAAWEYAKRGLQVIPLQGIRNGKCTCQEWRDKNGKGPCGTPGKHPRFRNWPERATTDAVEIEKWFSHDFKGSNVGIATGAASGIFVLDVDPKNGGDDSLDSLIAKYGRLPDTLQAMTGSGGRHYYFKHPGGTVPNEVSILPGLDIRGDGGQVVAAPSMHISGRRYDWDGLDGFDAPILPAPAWLLDLIVSKPRNGNGRGKVVSIGPAIPEGERNSALTRLAGVARRKGSSVEAINAYLQAENRDRCKPPLPEDEVRQIAESVGRYAPAETEPAAPSESPVSRVSLIERPFTDAGNAERLHALYGDRFRYSHPQRAFFVWDGTRWAQDERGAMRHLARETARELYSQAWDVKDADLQDQIIKHARKSEGSQAISNMLKEAGCIPGVAVLPDELDRGALLLNVRNGTLDLRTGELRPHRREDLLTKMAPVDYEPGAKCPRWLRFLGEVFAPHPDIPDFIQRAVGYSLTAETREECLFLCYGTGRNGKGVFLKTVCDVLGDYASTADFSAFLVRKNDGPRDDIANMRGRRLVRAEESNEGARLAEGIVKTLTGGDRVRARRLHENSYEFDPTWKIWLATNHKPAIRGTDPAIWSRLKLIPFEVSFAGREDRGLKQRLRDELPGILAWAVEGCLRWQEDGLEFPDSVLNATAEYRDESDHVGRFIAEECVTLPNCQSPARSLYGAYRKWAEAAGEGELTETEFGRRMIDRGYQRKRMNRGNVYMGVGLRADSEASV